MFAGDNMGEKGWLDFMGETLEIQLFNVVARCWKHEAHGAAGQGRHSS